MAFSFKQIGWTAEKVQKAIQKIERDRLRSIGKAMRPPLREAVKAARRLITVLFGGKGKRLKRALKSDVRIRPDDIRARFGYLRGKKNKFAGLGNIYEFGSNPARKSSKSGPAWVPIGDNRGKGGTPVVTAKEFFSNFQGRSVVKMSDRGNPIAFRREGSELVPMFLLRKISDIKVPKRSAVTPTAKKHLPLIAKAAGEKLFSNWKNALK